VCSGKRADVRVLRGCDGQEHSVGVIGVQRGMSFAGMAKHVGMELVALCDIWEEKLLEAGRRFGVATYTDYDAFLEHDMDAVIVANYCHEHARLRSRPWTPAST